MAARTLYVHRPVLNASDIIAWAEDQGLRTTLAPEDMHVTVCFSEQPMEWPEPASGEILVRSKLRTESRGVAVFGEDAVVLTFDSADLTERHESLVKAGAVSKYPSFRPHVTVTYDPGNIDPRIVEPYAGRIRLGPEVFSEIVDDWSSGVVEKRDGDAIEFDCQIAKLNVERGQAFGFASVATINGEPVTDDEDDQIDEEVLEEGAYGHVRDWRIADENHDGTNKGDLIESVFFTPEKCAAMQKVLRESGVPATIDVPAVVWWIGHQITDESVKQDVKSGKYGGFSIGGRASRSRATA